MTGAEMEALIARVEAATGPDRELDAEIAEAIGMALSDDRTAVYAGYRVNANTDEEYDVWDDVPFYSESLDAAVSLVPSGWVVEIIVQHPTYWAMKLRRLSDGMLVSGAAKTEQGTRTAAALRARQAMQDEKGEG